MIACFRIWRLAFALSVLVVMPLRAETSSHGTPAIAQTIASIPSGALAIGNDPALVVTAEQLAALPRRTVSTKQTGKDGERTNTWAGPLLWDVLVTAAAVDPAKHGDHSHLVLYATGRDGYVATVALAELSPDFENKSVIVADRMNDAPLPDHALRLIVPEDRRAGRSVRDLVRVVVGR